MNQSSQEDYKFYGVFDGHCGTRAAKYASRALHVNLELFLDGQVPVQVPVPVQGQGQGHGQSQGPIPDGAFGKTTANRGHFPQDHPNAAVERAVRAAFRKTQEDFLQLTELASLASTAPDRLEDGAGVGAGGLPSSADEDSGTTATVALVYPHVTVVAHVGDSRAVLCCDESGNAVDVTEGTF